MFKRPGPSSREKKKLESISEGKRVNQKNTRDPE